MPRKGKEEVFEFVGSPLPPRFEDIPAFQMRNFCRALNSAVLEWKRKKEVERKAQTKGGAV